MRTSSSSLFLAILYLTIPAFSAPALLSSLPDSGLGRPRIPINALPPDVVSRLFPNGVPSPTDPLPQPTSTNNVQSLPPAHPHIFADTLGNFGGGHVIANRQDAEDGGSGALGTLGVKQIGNQASPELKAAVGTLTRSILGLGHHDAPQSHPAAPAPPAFPQPTLPSSPAKRDHQSYPLSKLQQSGALEQLKFSPNFASEFDVALHNEGILSQTAATETRLQPTRIVKVVRRKQGLDLERREPAIHIGVSAPLLSNIPNNAPPVTLTTTTVTVTPTPTPIDCKHPDVSNDEQLKACGLIRCIGLGCVL